MYIEFKLSMSNANMKNKQILFFKKSLTIKKKAKSKKCSFSWRKRNGFRNDTQLPKMQKEIQRPKYLRKYMESG